MSRPHESLDLDALLAHGDFVRALARSLIRDPSRADDVEQDTWVAALERTPRRTSGPGLRAWLASVALNFARQSARRESRGVEREWRSARPEGLPSTVEVVQREATRRAVVEALLELDDPYRDVLLLRYYHELPPRDIARRLDVPVETVRTRLRRGIDKLRARLDTQGGREAWTGVLVHLTKEQRPSAPPVALMTVMAAGLGLGIAGIALALWWMRGETETRAARDHGAALVSHGAPTADQATVSLAPIVPEPARESLASSGEAPRETPPRIEPDRAVLEVRYALVPPERTLQGHVVDERERPIADALVFVGNQIRARGDEPFKPFEERRIPDGVRTDSTGRFEITGRGRSITAWHPEHGADTVPWEVAERVVLHDEVALRGFLVDGSATPLGGRTVVLDRGAAEAQTSADGSFTFDGVPVGIHGLRIDGGSYFAVDLPPGGSEPVTVSLISKRIDIELLAGDRPYLESIEGGWIGIDAALPIEPFRAEGGAGVVSHLAPGRYLLLLSGARAIPVDLTAGVEVLAVDLGKAELTVRGPSGKRVYLVPKGSSEFIQLMAGRLCSTPIPASGVLQLSALHAGAYEIGVDREGLLGPVEIGPQGAFVVLD